MLILQSSWYISHCSSSSRYCKQCTHSIKWLSLSPINPPSDMRYNGEDYLLATTLLMTSTGEMGFDQADQ